MSVIKDLYNVETITYKHSHRRDADFTGETLKRLQNNACMESFFGTVRCKTGYYKLQSNVTLIDK